MADPLIVRADWDPGAEVWMVVCSCCPSVTEAQSIEASRAKLPGIIADTIKERRSMGTNTRRDHGSRARRLPTHGVTLDRRYGERYCDLIDLIRQLASPCIDPDAAIMRFGEIPKPVKR